MSKSFLEVFLNRPVAMSMMYVALALCGLFALTRLSLDLTPAVEFPALTVRTSWPGASAETVEMAATAPIEEIANTVQGVRGVSSISREGSSEVSVEFAQKTDMNFARLEFNEKLSALAETLPAGVGAPTIEPFVPKQFQELQGFLTYSLVSTRSISELRKFGRDVIAPRLTSIRGVASVTVYGGEEREIQIELDSKVIAALGLDIERCTAALSALEYNAPVGGIFDRTSRNVVTVRNTGLRLEDIEHVTVAHTGSGALVRLSDIGTVRVGFPRPMEYFRINGKPSVTLVINKEPHVNTLQVADAVFAQIEEMTRLFPAGFELIKESDKSRRMREELQGLYRDGILSVLCIWIVLVVFLRELKAPLVVLSSILFSLAGTFLIFWIFGIGLHLLSLGGLVLGFGRLVDDSIVVLDNIQRRVELSAPFPSTARAVEEIALPVVASTLTTVGALGPTAFLPYELRPYFLEFSLAVAISLLMSLLVSFTFLPLAMSRVRIAPALTPALARAQEWSARLYSWMLRGALRHRVAAILTAVWLFGVPVWLLPESISGDGTWQKLYNSVLGSAMFRSVRPHINHALGGASHLFFTKVTHGEVWEMGKDTYLVVFVEFPRGTDLERYDRIAQLVEQEVFASGEGIEKMTCRVDPDRAIVQLDFTDAASLTMAPFALKNRLTMLAVKTGGASIGVYGFGPGFYSGGESAPAFAVKVLGYNYNKVKEIASSFRTRIERNPRIANVDIDRSWGERGSRSTELVARIDRARAAREDVTVAEVMNAVRTYTPGSLQRNTVSFEGERVPFTVKFAGYRDYSTEDLRKAVIVNTSGKTVRMSEVLTFEERRTPSEILRENQQYVRWISFEYKGPYKYGNAYVDATIRMTPLPSGYRFERARSWFQFTEEEQESMLLIAVVALVFVFMITASLYESFVKPLVVILSVPFSFIGLFLAFYIADAPFGRGGYASVILLVGIAVTNAIILVDCMAREIARSGPSVEALIAAAHRRVRPVLMTTLTTIGGLLPLLLLAERQSLWYSLALGAIGGLTTSTILTLLLIPVVYGMILRLPVVRTNGFSF